MKRSIYFSTLLMILSCTGEDSQFDTAQQPVETEETVALQQEHLQASLDWFITELAQVQISEILLLESALINEDPRCPEAFEGVADTMAWNSTCSTNTGLEFNGRSQSHYAESERWENVDYDQIATFISAYTIHSTTENWELFCNGYGDIRKNNSENWMEVVGTFDYQSSVQTPALHWPSTFQSIAVKMERTDENISVDGGISQAEGFEYPIVGMRFSSCLMNPSTIACTLHVQESNGQQSIFELKGSIVDCTQTEHGSLCWDMNTIIAKEW